MKKRKCNELFFFFLSFEKFYIYIFFLERKGKERREREKKREKLC